MRSESAVARTQTWAEWTLTWSDLVSIRTGQKSPGLGFPGGAVVENLPANAGDTGSSPGLGRSHMLRSN